MSLLPLLWLGLPICIRNLPLWVNFRTMLSCTGPTPPILLSSEGSAAGCCAAPVAADPDVALVIDVDAVVRSRPVVALARAAPVPDQVAGLIELQNRRRGSAAIRRPADSP